MKRILIVLTLMVGIISCDDKIKPTSLEGVSIQEMNDLNQRADTVLIIKRYEDTQIISYNPKTKEYVRYKSYNSGDTLLAIAAIMLVIIVVLMLFQILKM